MYSEGAGCMSHAVSLVFHKAQATLPDANIYCYFTVMLSIPWCALTPWYLSTAPRGSTHVATNSVPLNVLVLTPFWICKERVLN